jgi:hypothetical protein
MKDYRLRLTHFLCWDGPTTLGGSTRKDITLTDCCHSSNQSRISRTLSIKTAEELGKVVVKRMVIRKSYQAAWGPDECQEMDEKYNKL